LRQIEAAREIADNLSRSRNITYIPHQGNYLFQIPGMQSLKCECIQWFVGGLGAAPTSSSEYQDHDNIR
jgi:hypothetical protein